MENLTIADVKRNHKKAGGYFFAKSEMMFFKSKIETGLLKQKYFVTSEKCGERSRLYTIREIFDQGDRIKTVGNFQQYHSVNDAKEAIKNLTSSN